MTKFKHKYIFYFYPKSSQILTNTPRRQKKGIFRTLPTVKEGKEISINTGRKYDYKKIY